MQYCEWLGGTSESQPKMAETIVNLNSDEEIISDVDALKRILLQPEIKDKPVCVISITGTYRQGKSFLLNFLLRYLHLKYKVGEKVEAKWIRPEDGKISGFEWKCGTKGHTMGILMWSEVFTAQLPTGQEVAIVLLDTQGAFDNQSTKQQCAAIFAISTLISSVQIFNLKTQINQSDLEYLECFLGYGQLATDQTSDEPPFQNMCFLIRDWQCAYQHNFGASGGQDYLDDFLNSSMQALKEQNNKIRKLFKTMSCFLLPYPGSTVATEPDFQGEITDIDPKFLKHVEQVVPMILAPENLIPKVVNGKEIKAKDLIDFIQTYCEFFVSGGTPPLESMFLATASAQLNVITKEAIEIYKNSMNLVVNETSETMEEEDLQGAHLERLQEAVSYLNEKKVMGDDQQKDGFRKDLEEVLKDMFSKYVTINKMKLEREKQLRKVQEEFRRTEENLRSKLDGLKSEYESLLEDQKSEIEQSKERQEELESQMNDLRERMEENENEARREREKMENRVVELQRRPIPTFNNLMEENGLMQIIHGIRHMGEGVTHTAIGCVKVVLSPLKFLKFW